MINLEKPDKISSYERCITDLYKDVWSLNLQREYFFAKDLKTVVLLQNSSSNYDPATKISVFKVCPILKKMYSVSRVNIVCACSLIHANFIDDAHFVLVYCQSHPPTIDAENQHERPKKFNCTIHTKVIRINDLPNRLTIAVKNLSKNR